jgi:hypothetical protein
MPTPRPRHLPARPPAPTGTPAAPADGTVAWRLGLVVGAHHRRPGRPGGLGHPAVPQPSLPRRMPGLALPTVPAEPTPRPAPTPPPAHGSRPPRPSGRPPPRGRAAGRQPGDQRSRTGHGANAPATAGTTTSTEAFSTVGATIKPPMTGPTTTVAPTATVPTTTAAPTTTLAPRPAPSPPPPGRPRAAQPTTMTGSAVTVGRQQRSRHHGRRVP